MSDTFDTMIIGVARCGTSSLLRYLRAHPEVHAQTMDDRQAFAPSRSREEGAAIIAEICADAGDRLTLGKFAAAFTHPEALDRVMEHNPECRLILIVRDPVDRAYSIYCNDALKGQVRETYAETVDLALAAAARDEVDMRVSRYLDQGRYVDRFTETVDRYGRDSLHVVILEELESDPVSEYVTVCKWLGLDTTFRPDVNQRESVGGEARSDLMARFIDLSRTRNGFVRRSAERLPRPVYQAIRKALERANKRTRPLEPPPSKVTARLRDYFAEPNQQFAQALDREIDWPQPAANP